MGLSDYILAGILASLTITSLAGVRHALPRVDNDAIYLGVIGRVLVGMIIAVLWDNSLQQAFIASTVAVGAATMWEDIRRWRNIMGNDGRERQRRERLRLLRHKLRVAEQNLAYYAPGEAPIHLQVILEEIKREIAQEEQRDELG